MKSTILTMAFAAFGFFALQAQTATPAATPAAAAENWNSGIEFESAVFDGVRRCANKCIFCFVDQMKMIWKDYAER